MPAIYKYEKSSLEDFYSDQTVIIKKRYLSHISRVKYIPDVPEPVPLNLEWYPYCNSYYPYTEDVDALARVNHLLATKPSFESLASLRERENICERDPYSEKGAQLQYLSSNPVSFIILGKPGIGEQELGRLIADHWKCVYIEPEILIEEEIKSESRAGQCIEFNLRCGRAIGVDVILRLLEKRLKTKSAQHRGFLICGFPLIANNLYEEDPVSSESAIFNVREIFDDIIDTTVEIGIPPVIKNVSIASRKGEDESEEGEEKSLHSEEPGSGKTVRLPPKDELPLDIGSANSRICAAGEIGTNYEEQIDFIFSHFTDPFIIIYMMCSNADTISKRDENRFDIYSSSVINLQKEHSDKMLYTVFSKIPGEPNDEIPEDFLEIAKEPFLRSDSSQMRDLVKIPRDFPANVVSQLDNFRYLVLPVIERYVLMHDPQYFFKVDGRILPIRMFNAVKTKLKVLPLQKVILPQKLNVPPEPTGAEEEEVIDLNLEGLSHEEGFQLFRKKQIASPMFKWTWSDWGTKCPVSMKEGSYVDGELQYAVHFMNRIFFLADEAAYLKFYRNPRPYLLPPYPKPSCRIFVIGPKCSGKTAVAKCLAYLLNGTALCPEILRKQFMTQKENEYNEKIRSAALTEAITILNKSRQSDWEEKENEKKRRVQELLEIFKRILRRNIDLRSLLVPRDRKVSDVSYAELSSFPLKLAFGEAGESQISLLSFSVTLEKLTKLQDEFELYKLPCFDDTIMCQNLLGHPKQLLEFIPEELLSCDESTVEPATVFDDFVKSYADSAVNNADYNRVEMTLDHLSEMFIDSIKSVEDKYQEQGNNRGGWIIDGLPLQRELIEKFASDFLADDVFVLRDNSDYEFLLNRFQTKGLNEFRDFRNFFFKLGKTDAAWRSPSTKSTASYKETLAGDVIDDIISIENFPYDRKEFGGEGEGDNEDVYFKNHPRTAQIEEYNTELHQFDQQWEQIAGLFTELNIKSVEISITDKSLEDVLKFVVNNIEDRYRQQASEFTPEDRIQEVEDFGEPGAADEEIGEEGEDNNKDEEDLFAANRRFGDTFDYCPVTFHNHGVLWKGKEEYGAKYENKLYFMCSEEAMSKFIADPRTYLLGTNPPEIFPPPRICVAGAAASGKTTMSKYLSNNLGLYYIDYKELIKETDTPENTENNSELGELAEFVTTEETENDEPMVQNYLKNDEALPDEFLNKLLHPLWFEESVKTFGFVLDDFPKRPSDVAYMEKFGTIPDIIMELVTSEDQVHDRLVKKMLDEWHIYIAKQQELQDKKNREIMNEWEDSREKRMKQLMDLRREERYNAKLREQGRETDEEPDEIPRSHLSDVPETDEDETGRTKSMISFDSVAEEADYEAVNNILAEELPEPVFEDNWETEEEAIERITNQVEDSYVVDTEFIAVIKEQCDTAQIPWVVIDANLPLQQVFAQVTRAADQYKFRNNSLFERCYDVSLETVEKLLENGYYFISQFGRTCPVQVSEGLNSIQMFIPFEEKYQMFPMIHRNFIYFLAGKANRDKFKEDPLKYISHEKLRFPIIPVKLAVIGPPKSGKTALAERFRRDFGLKVISRGQAARYVLKYLDHSQLAKNMEYVLRQGWELTDEMVVKCVEAMAFDGKSISQGFVLDGFPNSIEEARHLVEVGLIPHLVIDLQGDIEQIHDCLATDPGKRGLPPFSAKFIDHRYNEWIKSAHTFRAWLDAEYQILTKISIQPSKWGVWSAAFDVATAVFSEVKHYYKYADLDLTLRLSNMQVTPLEFVERRSSFKNYCPCCLHYHYRLVNGGDPPDRTGLVHFRKHFYWLCQYHIEEFIDNPESFLTPYNNHSLPCDLPERIILTEMPDECYEDGLCIICYWENQPNRVVNKGSIDFAVLYRNKIYLFDTIYCMRQFMAEPFKYFNKSINFKYGPPYPSLEASTLPVLGFLEQYCAKQVIKAVRNTGILRPVVPGLSVSTSAAIYLGLYLKLHNPNTATNYVGFYEEAMKKLNDRRLKLIDLLAEMKREINPYLYYEEPLPQFAVIDNTAKWGEEPADSSSSSEIGIIASRVPIPDERFDYLCNYFKPLSKVPAFLNVVDIAGLVKGASMGQGLGNAFLAHISACEAIFHLCRAFEDTDVTHIEGEVDPVRDLEIICEELRLKDEEMLGKHLEKLERTVLRGGDKKQKPEYDVLVKIKHALVEEKQHIRFADWNDKEIEVLNKYLFLTSKPAIYLINLSEKDYIKKKNKWLIKIKEWVDKNDAGATIIPFSGALEQTLGEMDPPLKQKYLEDNNTSSALDKIIVQGYKALQLEYFFTAGADEVKAWTIQKGTKAPQAAGRIHTDFEKGFIMAEVMKYNDFKEEGTETAVKAAGKYRQQGRNYVVEDGDIIFFKFNAGAGLKEPAKKK